MSQIKVSNLSFCYEGSLTPVFENVSFQIDTGWKLGFTGRNGRGKTTFLKLLMGQYPYQGTTTHSTAFTYFPFPVSDPELTARAVAEEAAGEGEPWRLSRELSLLEVEEDEQNKQERRAAGREEKEAEARRRFELKQQKKKERHRGR